jgi:D-lactate dehydrogenase
LGCVGGEFLRIIFFEVQDWEQTQLKQAFKGDEVQLHTEAFTADNIEKYTDAEAISVFIYSEINTALLSKLPKLCLVATRSTGYDHIDLDACRKKGVAVCNVPTYGEITVAEHTFALILSLSRMIHDAYERSRRGDFTCQMVQGFDLNGKTLGVVGTGRIGRNVIGIAKGFNMKVLAFDKFPNAKAAESLGFEYVDAARLLREADVVTLHLPLSDETYHFLNKDTLATMKPSAVVINTARGGLIDTQALAEALVKKRLAGAGLDVLEEETLIREETQLLFDSVPRERLAKVLEAHILLRLSNVVITPHCAFNSRESLQRLVGTTIENILAFKTGKPQNLVK